MKRLLSILMAALMFYGLFLSIKDFDAATSWLELLKAVFWMLAFALSLRFFIGNVKRNEWPWE